MVKMYDKTHTTYKGILHSVFLYLLSIKHKTLEKPPLFDKKTSLLMAKTSLLMAKTSLLMAKTSLLMAKTSLLMNNT